MGFYLRKSFRFGPLRLNLSRSGLGASVGVTGARVGAGPRGAYVHAGRGGLYYRRSLSPRRSGSVPASPAVPRDTARGADFLEEIESADIGQLADASAAQLLADLNRVLTRRSLVPVLLASLALLALGMVAGSAPAWGYALVGVVALPGLLWARHLDVTRGTVVLQYALDADEERAFAGLRAAFTQLAACRAVWHVEAAGQIGDQKRQAGATEVVRRQPIAPRLSCPPRVASNLEVPMLPAGRQALYFFPDRVLVYERRGVGTVPYGELQVEAATTRFVEAATVPADAQVVDKTWRYVNKSGGPDRRFRDNPELPVVLYGELHLTSPSGLNEQVQCSRPEAAAALASAMEGQRAANG